MRAALYWGNNASHLMGHYRLMQAQACFLEVIMDGWYIWAKNREQGPFTPEQIRDFVNRGKLTPEIPIKKAGMQDFVPAGRVQGLFPQGAGQAAMPSTVAVQRAAAAPAPAPQPEYVQEPECLDDEPQDEVIETRDYIESEDPMAAPAEDDYADDADEYAEEVEEVAPEPAPARRSARGRRGRRGATEDGDDAAPARRSRRGRRAASEEEGGSKKGLIIIILVVLVLGGTGAGLYFGGVFGGGDTADTTQTTDGSDSSSTDNSDAASGDATSTDAGNSGDADAGTPAELPDSDALPDLE